MQRAEYGRGQDPQEDAGRPGAPGQSDGILRSGISTLGACSRPGGTGRTSVGGGRGLRGGVAGGHIETRDNLEAERLVGLLQGVRKPLLASFLAMTSKESSPTVPDPSLPRRGTCHPGALPYRHVPPSPSTTAQWLPRTGLDFLRAAS